MYVVQERVLLIWNVHVRAGSVPLRQLVYRVLALPPSMQPLVYDFGQLTNNTEEAYTAQIVTDKVSKLSTI